MHPGRLREATPAFRLRPMRVAMLPSGALLADTAPVDDEASDGLSVTGRAGRFRRGLPTDDLDRNDTGRRRDPAVDSQ